MTRIVMLSMAVGVVFSIFAAMLYGLIPGHKRYVIKAERGPVPVEVGR